MARTYRPFEYMAWAKAVPPGAAFTLQVSGLGPPAALTRPTLPDWGTWSGPTEPARTDLAAALARYVGMSGNGAVIAAGASEALFLALASRVEHGRPVIVEQPAYRAAERAVQFLGGEPVRLERLEAEGWRFDVERLDALLGESGAATVALTDPHNPTGASIDGATRAAIVQVIERRRAVLVVDETFAPFRGPRRPPAWAAASASVLSVGGLTKAWGMAALRCGWVVGAAALLDDCGRIFDLLGVNAPSAMLALAREALDEATHLDERAAAACRAAHASFSRTDWGAVTLTRADDGIIAFLRLPPGGRSEEAAAALRALDGVQVVPGHFFGRDDCLRIGFDPECTDGVEGCRRIAQRLGA